MEENEERILTHLTEQHVEYSPDRAVSILAGVEHKYYLAANSVNDALDPWYIPLVWVSDNVLPISYQSIPKERIAFMDAECFIAPPFEPATGDRIARTLFGGAEIG
jgi:hypothetical protein